MKVSAFSKLHPFSIFLYFILLFCSGAFTMHPCFIALSFIGALIFALCLRGAEILKKWYLLLFPLLTAAAVNFLFNHRGRTKLCYLPSGNALTLEALVYGLASGVMLSAVMIWCYCFYKTFSSDKLMCLTGKIFPALTVMLSMTLRAIPLTVRRFREISDARSQIGRGPRDGSIVQRLRNLAAIFSILITRSLESSVVTADSMKSRGYGLPGRTSFDRFRFTLKDILFVLVSAGLFAAALFGLLNDRAVFRYYPAFYFSEIGVTGVVELAGFGSLCFLPGIYELLEEVRWRSLISSL